MSIRVEKEIQSYLSKGESSEKIVAHLLKRKNLCKAPNDFLAICHFMYQAGLYKKLLQTTCEQISKKKVIPWNLIIHILSKHQINIPKKTKELFLKGIKMQKQVRQILSFKQWDAEFLVLSKWKKTVWNQIYQSNNQNLIKLMEDLAFIKNQGVLKKEEEILKQLLEIDPKNPNLQEEWTKLKEKQDRHSIEQHKLKILKKSYLDKNITDKKETQIAETIFQAARDLLKNAPQLSNDIAILFSFIGYPHLAVKILEKHLYSSTDEWLYIELLLQSGLYIKCLTMTDYMAMKYKGNPDIVSALSYIRAISYYHLGKKKEAKELLSELAKVKPNYRLTHFLLKQWE